MAVEETCLNGEGADVPSERARDDPSGPAFVQLVVIGAGCAALTLAARLQGMRDAKDVLGACRRSLTDFPANKRACTQDGSQNERNADISIVLHFSHR